MDALSFKLHRSYLILFNLSNAGEIFGVESEMTVSQFRKNSENVRVVFSYSMKRVREIRKFHVAIMQKRSKSVIHVQSCCFSNVNVRIFCCSRCRRRHRCLSSPLLLSKHFAAMVT